MPTYLIVLNTLFIVGWVFFWFRGVLGSDGVRRMFQSIHHDHRFVVSAELVKKDPNGNSPVVDHVIFTITNKENGRSKSVLAEMYLFEHGLTNSLKAISSKMTDLIGYHAHLDRKEKQKTC